MDVHETMAQSGLTRVPPDAARGSDGGVTSSDGHTVWVPDNTPPHVLYQGEPDKEFGLTRYWRPRGDQGEEFGLTRYRLPEYVYGTYACGKLVTWSVLDRALIVPELGIEVTDILGSASQSVLAYGSTQETLTLVVKRRDQRCVVVYHDKYRGTVLFSRDACPELSPNGIFALERREATARLFVVADGYQAYAERVPAAPGRVLDDGALLEEYDESLWVTPLLDGSEARSFRLDFASSYPITSTHGVNQQLVWLDYAPQDP